ncbi:Ras-related protein Rab-17 [Mactra antiquata]
MVLLSRKGDSDSVSDARIDFGMDKPKRRSNRSSFLRRHFTRTDTIHEYSPDFYFKTVLLGDCGVGKSSLTRKFSTSAYRTCNVKRPGIGFMPAVEYVDRILEVSGKHVLTRLYDTAGQEKFRSLTASYYRGAHGALVLFDVTKESTFNNVGYWLHDLKEYSSHPDVSTILVGTKCHVEPDEREVSLERAQKYAESVGLPYMEVSAEEGKHVTEVFEKLADLIIEKLSKEQSLNMSQPSRVILQDQQKPKKQWCSC